MWFCLILAPNRSSSMDCRCKYLILRSSGSPSQFLAPYSRARVIWWSLQELRLRSTPDGRCNLASSGLTNPVVVAIAQGIQPIPDLWPAASAVIDLFGAEGTAYPFAGQPFPIVAGTVGMFRANGGCQNSGDNRLDFATAPPAPRNLSSPLIPCSGALPTPTIVNVVNAATLRASAVAPGALMIIEGTGFVNGHTTVTVDGHAAATYGATSTQILFTVPFLLSGQSAQLEVHVDQPGL